ncbi:M48 family metallopeptidase [Rhizophagus clarus]|nr:M48 family metallopeptidase [Rhizophagus clarus]
MISNLTRNLILKNTISKNLLFKQNGLLRKSIQSTFTRYPLTNYSARSFYSDSQATIVPLLPTLLFSLPLCVPYFLTLRMIAAKTLSPQIRTKITYSLGSALLTIPTIFLFTSDVAPNTYRKRFMLLWPWEERKLINKANECVENVLGTEEIIPENDNRSKLVNHILDRIWESNNNKINSDLKKPVIYLINNDDILDGVSYPCSAITLTTSWLRLVDYNEDLLAAVLSHEIAHILQNHASEFYGLSFTFKALTQLHDMFYDFLSLLPGFNKVNWIRPLIYLQKHSQTLEKEADLLGQELMANAGYDPANAINLWELMCNISSSQIPDESHHDDGHGVRHSSESSHPSKEQRV